MQDAGTKKKKRVKGEGSKPATAAFVVIVGQQTFCMKLYVGCGDDKKACSRGDGAGDGGGSKPATAGRSRGLADGISGRVSPSLPPL